MDQPRPAPGPPGDDLAEELRAALAPELQLLERLGGGGMGEVYLARDPVLKRNVAVKVLARHLGQSGQARLRFAREAEAAAAVAHPNVVPIYRVGELPRSRLGYIVMAHLDGGTLAEVIPEGTVASESTARRIVGEVASALAAAHARGVVHRDIKPANVLYDTRGGRFVVVDFGIAAVLGRDSGDPAVRLTVDGLPVGTPEYMSPEQAAGDRVGQKSDVYSLGCVAYELLAGRPPVSGATPGAVARAQIHQDPAPLRSLRSDLSPEFAALVMRCLRKEPEARPDAEELARALGIVTRPIVEWPPPGLEALHRQGAQWTRALGRFALALFAFVLTLGIHPAGARPCCADMPDRSPGWLLLKRLSLATPIHFDDPDALAIWYFLLDAAFLVAFAALLPFAARTVRLAGQLLGGRRMGYPLAVLARVAWDRHRDTRDLVNGTGRYALTPPERQAAQLQRRSVAAGAAALSLLALIGTSVLWLTGRLQIAGDPMGGVLSLPELAAIGVPAALLLGLYLVLEALDLRRRWTPGWARRRTPVRADVREAWIAAAGVRARRERWRGVAVAAAGALGVGLAALGVAVAAYGLVGVFGASARFAGERGPAAEWLRAYQRAALVDSTPPPLAARTALALTASVPLGADVGRILAEARLPATDRRRLAESVGPAFCLNPREVLVGISDTRRRERDRAMRLLGEDGPRADPAFAAAVEGRGISGLRRRARFCERYLGQQATISPPLRLRE